MIRSLGLTTHCATQVRELDILTSFCLAVNGMFDVVWGEDVETSEIVDAMENVFWALEDVTATDLSGYWEPLQQDVTQRLLAFLSPAGGTGG